MAFGNKVQMNFSWIDWVTVVLTFMGVIANALFTIVGIASHYDFRTEACLVAVLVAVAFVGFYLIVFSFLLNKDNKLWQKVLVFLFPWGVAFSLDFYASLLGAVAIEELAKISSSDWFFRWLIALFVTSCGSGVTFYITQKITNVSSTS
jgi:magnesium-transporting ATPase (P-type)